MINLNDIEITEEQFRDIAEREGYVKEFEYPIYKESISAGVVIRFTALRIGTVIVAGRYSAKVGTETYGLKPHTSDYWKEWNPHEELKKQYAEDAKIMEKPWKLWERVSMSDEGRYVRCIREPQWLIGEKYRRKDTKPKTYDGLTEEQWRQVKDEGLVCEFWNVDANEPTVIHTGLMDELDTGAVSPYFSNSWWKHCRIHRSQPQYVIDGKKPDWLDDGAMVCVKYSNNKTVYCDYVCSFAWKDVVRFQVMGL